MSRAHVAQILHNSLHRGVQRDVDDLLQFSENREEFFIARNTTYAVNLLAYALGHLPPVPVTDHEQWERCDGLVTDRKLRQSLSTLVGRMPTLEFQLIPLVLLHDDRLDTSFLLRVRKAPGAPDCVYLDLNNRKYDQFGQFLTANKLPPCTLWYPIDGLLRYKRDTGGSMPSLQIESRQITPTGNVWQEIVVAGGALASLFAFTTIGATVAIPLTFIGSIFSATDLVDSCKHDPASGVARRAVALTLNLTMFASAGVTAACRVGKLQKLVPAEKLLQLERAEQFLAATRAGVGAGSVALSLVARIDGWKSLSAGEWMELAALLCFAYRMCFNETNAIQLVGKMQRTGVMKFFQNLCPNVSVSALRAQLAANNGWFAQLLQFTVEFLANGVQFTVDGSFTTISLYGYKLQFDALFKIKWTELRMLLLFLQSSKTDLCAAVCADGKNRWTQFHVDDVVKLLQFVSQLRHVSCKLLADYIVLGHGHRFTLGTVRAFLTAKKLDKLRLLRQLASLDTNATEALNELRDSGHISGGDRELMKWLANHQPESYGTALNALLSLYATRPNAQIAFDHNRIVASPLLAFSAEDFLKVPADWRDILLHDERFLRLAVDIDESLLLPRATGAWLRTCSSGDAIHYRETIGLLRQLFERTNTPDMLAFALDYALGPFENGATSVPQVYYSILSAWKQLSARPPPAPLDKRTMQARFAELMVHAESLDLARYHRSPVHDNLRARDDDDSMVRFARVAIQELADVPAGSDCSIPFGPIERAAFWLGMIPALRVPVGRKRILQRIVMLVKSDAGRVLQPMDETNQYHRQTMDIRRVMFAKHGDMIMVEVKIPPNGYAHVSLYLCGSSICAVGDEDTKLF